jgi:phage portal protein BeeE
MTAAKVATYKGARWTTRTNALHASITRYAAGVENSFGLMLVPDDVTITNLGVEPEKAQMMLAREWGVREVARFAPDARRTS